MSDPLWPHELQHARPLCPSPTPGVHPNSCPSSRWYHPAISSTVVPFSCPQSLPASESFPMRQLFAWGGQSTGVSASASFLPKKSQGWSPSDWLDLLAVQGTLKSLLQHHSSKASILQRSAFFTVQLSHPYMTTGKTIALTRRIFGQIYCSHASVYSPYCSWLCVKNWKCWSAHSLHESSRKSYHLESCETAPSQVPRTLAKAHAA